MAITEPSFADRLDLVLKALSMSRGRLAVEVGVDKSLVTRWLNASIRPSPYNLERITRAIKAHCADFTMLDWEADFGALEERLGVAKATPKPSSETAMNGPWALPFGLIEAANKETARRGASYAARWTVMRPGASGQLVYYADRALIRPVGDGLWLEHHTAGHMLAGGVLVLCNRLYAMTADSTDDSFNFYLLSGIAGPRAMVLEGAMMSAGCGVHDDPFAMPMVFKRAGELEDEAADDEWARGGPGNGKIAASELPPDVRAIFDRDFGPSAVAAGGDAILRIRR